MATTRRLALFAAAVALAPASAKVTPMEKVLTLLKDLKAEVESEGKAEAKTYDEFACFCRDKTMTLAKDITSEQDKIDQISGKLEKLRAEWGNLQNDVIPEKKSAREDRAKELTDTEARCDKDQAEYDANNADLARALTGLGGAIKTLESAQPSAAGANLLAVKSVVKQNLELAEAMRILDHSDAAFAQVNKLRSFVQLDANTMVDPQDPEYKSHNQDIIAILKKLQGDFAKQKTESDTEWAKTSDNCDKQKKFLGDTIAKYTATLAGQETNLEKVKRHAGEARGQLVDVQASLRDNKVYLEDLTKMCEKRAADWDQRSAARAEEFKAISKAQKILMDDAVGVEDVNERAFLQEKPSVGNVSLSGSKKAGEVAPHAKSAPSFMQQQQKQKMGGRTSMFRLAARRSAGEAGQVLSGAAALEAAQEERRGQVLSAIQEASGRLHSNTLAVLAVRVAADPFAKVKELIVNLIARLVGEAAMEATKKGFCDTKLAVARQERDTRWNKVNQLVASASTLAVKEEELTMDIKELKASIKKLGEDLNEAEGIRKKEMAENTLAISKAKQGYEAVKSAIAVLKLFYKDAAKAALVQTGSHASPVDEDTTGAGFEGSYKGKQAGADGILGMLDVLASDFDRTLRVTKKEEADAREKFVLFERGCKSDTAGKSVTLERSEEDLDTTTRTKDSTLEDLKTNMNLVDSALKQLEELRPQCIDTGMSHDDRMQKREDEIAALKKSLCMLDHENVEPDC